MTIPASVEIKYVYDFLRFANVGGGMTICYYIEPTDNKTIHYSIARCHPKDKFNKSIGKQLALDNLKNSTKGTVFSVTYADSVEYFKEEYNNELIKYTALKRLDFSYISASALCDFLVFKARTKFRKGLLENLY